MEILILESGVEVQLEKRQRVGSGRVEYFMPVFVLRHHCA